MSQMFYEDIYKYISTGGQGLVFQHFGISYCFRIPTPLDYTRCLEYSDVGDSQEAFLLSICLKSVGGFKVSKYCAYHLLKEIESCPKLLKRVMPHFWEAVKNNTKMPDFFEAFCYTPSSRYLWRKWTLSSKFGFHLPKDSELSEIHIQWISFNEVEDKKEEIEEAWSRAFFQASSMNPKGVKKVQKEWDKRKESEKEYRAEVIAKAEQGVKVNREDSDSKITEDLQREYHNWVEGVEDEHDVRVRKYKEDLNKFIRNGRKWATQQESNVQQMREDLNSLSMVSPLRAFSDSEIDQMVKERNTIPISEGEEYDSLLSRKYLNAKEVTKPENSSLMDKISNRKLPTM